MFERAAVVELHQLGGVLSPPCRLGPYVLTATLAQSATALLFTASGGVFEHAEGVLKLASSHHAARLEAELEHLVQCADAGVRGVIQPLARELEWLPVPGLLDAHVATMALPFFTGGDLRNVKRARDVHPAEVANVVGTTLRHLLELPSPIVHGNLSSRCVLLPRPHAALSELALIDLGAAQVPTPAACRADVAAFGALLLELLSDTSSRALRTLAADCFAEKFSSLADPRLWKALRNSR